jgi:hypothetical protein
MFWIGEDWISCNRTNESGNDLRKIYMIVKFCIDVVGFKKQLNLCQFDSHY